MSAAMRYLSQRYMMPNGAAKGTITDIGTEELAHLEIIATTSALRSSIKPSGQETR